MKQMATAIDTAYTEYIPVADPRYVPEGCYEDIVRWAKSKRWIPLWVTGPTGIAKTMSIQEACAVAGRELFRVQITAESDEAALLGTFHLRNGETEFIQSPIITAMERGAVLLLDECDLAGTKAMCLQPVLEGKAVNLTRAKRRQVPRAGFQVIATGNTTGNGDESGSYIGTQIINEAFMNRIGSMTIEHGYPNPVNERNILRKVMAAAGVMDEQFITQLVEWANHCRTNYEQRVIQHNISPRHLCLIAEALAVWDDKDKLINMATARFTSVDRAAIRAAWHMFDGVSAATDLTKSSTSQLNTW